MSRARTTTRRLAGALMGMALLAPAGADAMVRNDLSGWRLEGTYVARYDRDAFGEPARWRMDPRCGQGACNTAVSSSGGLQGVFLYRFASEAYYLEDKQDLAGTCEGPEGTVEDAFREIRTIRISRFASELDGGIAEFARGTVVDIRRATPKAQAAGCETERSRANVRLKRR